MEPASLVVGTQLTHVNAVVLGMGAVVDGVGTAEKLAVELCIGNFVLINESVDVGLAKNVGSKRRPVNLERDAKILL